MDSWCAIFAYVKITFDGSTAEKKIKMAQVSTFVVAKLW